MDIFPYMEWYIASISNGLSPSHYLNQYSNIINWRLGSKKNRYLYIFTDGNAFKNVVCKMASML